MDGLSMVVTRLCYCFSVLFECQSPEACSEGKLGLHRLRCFIGDQFDELRPVTQVRLDPR